MSVVAAASSAQNVDVGALPSAAGAIVTATPSAANDEVPRDLAAALENLQTGEFSPFLKFWQDIAKADGTMVCRESKNMGAGQFEEAFPGRDVEQMVGRGYLYFEINPKQGIST